MARLVMTELEFEEKMDTQMASATCRPSVGFAIACGAHLGGQPPVATRAVAAGLNRAPRGSWHDRLRVLTGLREAVHARA
jgi:hypothetical protein